MNLEQFRKLPFKEKMKWIWDYYSVTIAVVIVAVVVIVFLIMSMLGVRESQKIELSILILDDRMNQESANRLRDQLSDSLAGNIEIAFYSKSNAEQFQAFVVKTAVDGPDIVIAPLNEISEMAENEYVNNDYIELDSSSFYADILSIGDEFDRYEEVYISLAKRGENMENAKIIWERYSLDE